MLPGSAWSSPRRHPMATLPAAGSGAGSSRQPPERVRRGRPRLGHVHDQPLVGVGDVQYLAGELQRPDDRVVDALAHGVALGYLALGPHAGEPRRQRQQLGHQLRHVPVAGELGVGGPQVGDRGPRERERVLIGPVRVVGRLGEHPADHVPLALRDDRQVADEVHGEPVPGQDVVPRRDDVGGRFRHQLQQVPYPRGHVAGRPGCWPGRLARDPEQVLPLIGGEHQRPRQRGEHLPGRPRAAPLLQPDVIVDRQARELGDLLPPQPRRAPPLPARQPHVAGRQPLRRVRRNAASSVRFTMISIVPLRRGRASGWLAARVVLPVPASPRLSRGMAPAPALSL